MADLTVVHDNSIPLGGTNTTYTATGGFWLMAPLGSKPPDMAVRDGVFASDWGRAWSRIYSTGPATISMKEPEHSTLYIPGMCDVLPGRYMIGWESDTASTRYVITDVVIDLPVTDFRFLAGPPRCTLEGSWTIYTVPVTTVCTVRSFFRLPRAAGT